ncbi:HK97 family phage prohead protease [Dinoroseobacter sp. S375]|uniref:HK97 family phage prohead protease n=1 Tax=Dinoroseobacter sp. S375 TaxID=3415136 RepID=UPI003C7A4F42
MTTREPRGKWSRQPVEVRADGDELVVEGYASVFGQRANIGGYFEEQIERGAFKDAIGRDEVVFLFNHDDGTVMARSSAGNLDLSEDDTGLKVTARLSQDDPDAAKLAAKMRAGNVNKMSFAFIPDVEEWDDTGDLPLRTIKRASLFDVSAVTTPAYDGTDIGLRSLEAHRKQRNFSAVRTRMRMKADLAQRENG